ncbi:tripartite tricarboxylate transporter permease [Synergistaceae bacterium OttesenSCG-928-I11]|nr:tripartite tricarboxylate transporter permease [Synergistaceae bacterium OttesenSCG-928-I11]
MYAQIMEAFSLIFNVNVVLIIIGGSLLGLVVGSLPGLSGTMAIAIALPITFYISPWFGIPLILSIYKSSQWAGAVGSILINTPGNAANAAILLDGYPLRKQGHGQKALEASLKSGWAADVLSDVITIMVCQPLAAVALYFRPPEFALIIVTAFLMIATMGSGSAIKTLMAAALGLFVSTFGQDPLLGTPRLNFNIPDLYGGFNLVPLLIGVFAMSELFTQMMDRFTGVARARATQMGLDVQGGDGTDFAPEKFEHFRFRDLRHYFAVWLRSSLIGTWVGVLPGIGSGVSPWIAYGVSKARSKKPEEYGKGSMEGLISAQAACNAVGGANLVPLIALGIPGDTTAAILLGALMVHGIQPGPTFIKADPVSVYAIFATLIVCDIVYYWAGKFFIKGVSKISAFDNTKLVPFVLMFCVLGTYAINTSLFDVYVMFAFGVVGYVMKKFGYSPPAFVIAFVLGYLFEMNLRQTFRLSDGRIWVFLKDPICLVLFALNVFLCFYFLKKTFDKKRGAQSR